MTMPRFGSKKFWIFWFSVALLATLPFVYNKYGIDISVQLLVLGAIASATLSYHITDALCTKWGGTKDVSEYPNLK